jgi:hypothetical protein
LTGRDVLAAAQDLPRGVLPELEALNAALPGYDVLVSSRSGQARYEAIRRGIGPGPWCVISRDPADLWRELAGRPRPAALDGDEAGRALLMARLMARLTISSYPAGALPPVPPCPLADGGLPQRARPGAVPGGNHDGVVRDRELLRRIHRGLKDL